jgi:rhodanese-related sulfurtransferase
MQSTTTRTAAELVAEAKRSIDNLTADQVATELSSSHPLLVDIREADELVQSGTIPGAVHAPRGMLEFYADTSSPYHRGGFEPARRTLVYCASGGRSALAVQALRQLGYRDVAHLDGGIKAWLAGGREVERR